MIDLHLQISEREYHLLWQAIAAYRDTVASRTADDSRALLRLAGRIAVGDYQID